MIVELMPSFHENSDENDWSSFKFQKGVKYNIFEL